MPARFDGGPMTGPCDSESEGRRFPCIAAAGPTGATGTPPGARLQCKWLSAAAGSAGATMLLRSPAMRVPPVRGNLTRGALTFAVLRPGATRIAAGWRICVRAADRELENAGRASRAGKVRDFT